MSEGDTIARAARMLNSGAAGLAELGPDLCRDDADLDSALDAAARRAVLETAARLLRANLDTPRRVTAPGGLAVYGRAGRPCRRCRTPIRRRRQGPYARSTYWCPTCQPMHNKRADQRTTRPDKRTSQANE